MRCSVEFWDGDGDGVGRVVRVRCGEWASGCWIASMVLGMVAMVVYPSGIWCVTVNCE